METPEIKNEESPVLVAIQGFTPGPWDFFEDVKNPTAMGNSIIVVAPDPGDPQPWYVAEVYKEIGGGSDEEVRANARLIAAAPALFDVVERLCYALAASGVVPIHDSNDPVESLFYQAAEIRMKIVAG